MNRLFLTLEDGAVFEGCSVNEALETAGLLSFYTGVVGYQEVLTDPANKGKIICFTYPLIGNYGVNSEDAESSAPKAAGALVKEYSPYYSNFRATGSLSDYLANTPTVFGQGFDTRAILLHLRDHGEMRAATAGEPLTTDAVIELAEKAAAGDYVPENTPIACAQARARVKASVIDFGASRSFYKQLAALGVDACCDADKADILLVSDAPYFKVESACAIDQVKSVIGQKPVIGFGHGCALVAQACGVQVERMAFGDHGVNIPVGYVGGGRNEITVQNHNYQVVPGTAAQPLFVNIHSGACEGFTCKEAHAVGVNFVPGKEWFEALLASVGVK